MQAVILQCRPRARFHFGKVAPDNNSSLNDTSEWLPSDTLFSALINTLALFCDKSDVDRIVGHFDTGQVRISSGFYLLRTLERDIFLLPKPNNLAFEVTENFKDFNRVQLISRTVWEHGWAFKEWPDKCYFLQKGVVVVAKSELPELTDKLKEIKTDVARIEAVAKIRLFSKTDYPRVKVHSPDQQNAFFYLSTICLADNHDLKYLPEGSSAHLYFLLDVEAGFEKNADYATLLTAIRLLPDQGLGGERTAGCGLFEKCDFQHFAPPQVIGETQQCSLSLSLPTADELTQALAYSVITRGGREYTGGKLDYIRMMSEGAVSDSVWSGRIAKVGEHGGTDFLRYGKAFCLPVRAIPPPKSTLE